MPCQEQVSFSLMTSPQIPIAKEGMPFICLAAFTTILSAILGYEILTLILLLLTLFISWFFRDPDRISPVDQSCMVSPADGKIILIEKSDNNEFIDGEAYKVSIFMNIFNVHVNRVPFSGKIERIVYSPGSFYSADSSRGDLKNERCATLLVTENNDRIAFVQVAGLIARRIICWLEPGDKVKRGSRFGLIRFGSRVDLHLPASMKLGVKVGDCVKAGESIIGSLR